jgi:hypothetical protein
MLGLPQSKVSYLHSSSSSIFSIGSMYWVQKHCGIRHLPTFVMELLFSEGSCISSV